MHALSIQYQCSSVKYSSSQVFYVSSNRALEFSPFQHNSPSSSTCSSNEALDVAKPIIEDEIETKLEISSTQDSFCIADFGCSTGKNSFQAIQIIIEAIKRKLEILDLKIPEFYVFLNDIVTNDYQRLHPSFRLRAIESLPRRNGQLGKLSEAKIDSFNIPHYMANPQELKALLERNHKFTIERMEILNDTGKSAFASIGGRNAAVRAVYESMLASNFGGEIMDELFDLYEKKIAASTVFSDADNDKTIMILAVLKRTID